MIFNIIFYGYIDISNPLIYNLGSQIEQNEGKYKQLGGKTIMWKTVYLKGKEVTPNWEGKTGTAFGE